MRRNLDTNLTRDIEDLALELMIDEFFIYEAVILKRPM